MKNPFPLMSVPDLGHRLCPFLLLMSRFMNLSRYFVPTLLNFVKVDTDFIRFISF